MRINTIASRTYLTSALILGACFWQTGCAGPGIPSTYSAASGSSDQKRLDSVELKVLMEPSVLKSDDSENQFDFLWSRIAHHADDAGIEFIRGISSEKRRLINYLDTKNHRLRSQGYTLRQRTKLDSFDDNWLSDDNKKKPRKQSLTVKFRSDSRSTAAEKDLSSPFKYKNKLELDIAVGGRQVFSQSSKVKIRSSSTKMKFGQALGYFPGLKELGIRKKTTLRPVSKHAILGRSLTIGEIFVDGEAIELDLETWSVNGGRTETLVEMSLKYSLPLESDAADRLADFFYSFGKDPYIELLQGNSTKTGFAYED